MLAKFAGIAWHTEGLPTLAQVSPRARRGGGRVRGSCCGDRETAAPAVYPQTFIKPESQGQDALPARRRGIAGHLLPPVGGEANSNANSLRSHWKGPLEKNKK